MVEKENRKEKERGNGTAFLGKKKVTFFFPRMSNYSRWLVQFWGKKKD